MNSTRQPFQVLVFPYTTDNNGEYKFALFQRSDEHYWQGIAGGGEHNEKPIDAASREAFEEAAISGELLELVSTANLPAPAVAGFLWGEGVFIIPEYSFGIAVNEDAPIKISREHTTYQWFAFAEAIEKLKWDSNKTALWELNYRLSHNGIDGHHNRKLIQSFSQT